MDAQLLIEERLKNSVEAKSRFVQTAMADILRLAAMMRQVLEAGGTLYFFGNGGSAADSQHWAAEIVGRFQKERKGLPAIALTVDTSILTAIANDYGYDRIFARQVEALGNAGDVLVAVSTSGNSANVLAAIEEAKTKGIKSIGMTAAGGGKMAEVCDVCLVIPDKVTARAQEVHGLIGHILCEIVEE